MPYAAQTKVSIALSKTDIEALLTSYGATGFGYITEGDRAMVAFNMEGRRVQLMLVMPSIDDFALTRGNSGRTAAAQESAREQAYRSRWPALLLIIKAKLEEVEAGITNLETEFLANIVLANGVTVGQVTSPQIEEHYQTGKMPALLPGS